MERGDRRLCDSTAIQRYILVGKKSDERPWQSSTQVVVTDGFEQSVCVGWLRPDCRARFLDSLRHSALQDRVEFPLVDPQIQLMNDRSQFSAFVLLPTNEQVVVAEHAIERHISAGSVQEPIAVNEIDGLLVRVHLLAQARPCIDERDRFILADRVEFPDVIASQVREHAADVAGAGVL